MSTFHHSETACPHSSNSLLQSVLNLQEAEFKPDVPLKTLHIPGYTTLKHNLTKVTNHLFIFTIKVIIANYISSWYAHSNSNKSITYFGYPYIHWKIIFLALIWTSDLPSTKLRLRLGWQVYWTQFKAAFYIISTFK